MQICFNLASLQTALYHYISCFTQLFIEKSVRCARKCNGNQLSYIRPHRETGNEMVAMAKGVGRNAYN